MLQIKNKSLGKLLRNKYVYYVVVALSVLNVLKYLNTGNVYCLLSFVGITVLSNKFLIKNMTFSLLLALFVASFFLGCGKIIEGMDQNGPAGGPPGGPHGGGPPDGEPPAGEEPNEQEEKMPPGNPGNPGNPEMSEADIIKRMKEEEGHDAL